MELAAFLELVKTSPDKVTFAQTISVIESHYEFSETAFRNGDCENGAGQNNGSCKIFAFAQLNQLDEQATLSLFGDYYRVDVLGNPEGEDHQNIRNFIQHGWSGISFQGSALARK